MEALREVFIFFFTICLLHSTKGRQFGSTLFPQMFAEVFRPNSFHNPNSFKTGQTELQDAPFLSQESRKTPNRKSISSPKSGYSIPQSDYNYGSGDTGGYGGFGGGSNNYATPEYVPGASMGGSSRYGSSNYPSGGSGYSGKRYGSSTGNYGGSSRGYGKGYGGSSGGYGSSPGGGGYRGSSGGYGGSSGGYGGSSGGSSGGYGGSSGDYGGSSGGYESPGRKYGSSPGYGKSYGADSGDGSGYGRGPGYGDTGGARQGEYPGGGGGGGYPSSHHEDGGYSPQQMQEDDDFDVEVDYGDGSAKQTIDSEYGQMVGHGAGYSNADYKDLMNDFSYHDYGRPTKKVNAYSTGGSIHDDRRKQSDQFRDNIDPYISFGRQEHQRERAPWEDDTKIHPTGKIYRRLEPEYAPYGRENYRDRTPKEDRRNIRQITESTDRYSRQRSRDGEQRDHVEEDRPYYTRSRFSERRNNYRTERPESYSTTYQYDRPDTSSTSYGSQNYNPSHYHSGKSPKQGHSSKYSANLYHNDAGTVYGYRSRGDREIRNNRHSDNDDHDSNVHHNNAYEEWYKPKSTRKTREDYYPDYADSPSDSSYNDRKKSQLRYSKYMDVEDKLESDKTYDYDYKNSFAFPKPRYVSSKYSQQQSPEYNGMNDPSRWTMDDYPNEQPTNFGNAQDNDRYEDIGYDHHTENADQRPSREYQKKTGIDPQQNHPWRSHITLPEKDPKKDNALVREVKQKEILPKRKRKPWEGFAKMAKAMLSGRPFALSTKPNRESLRDAYSSGYGQRMFPFDYQRRDQQLQQGMKFSTADTIGIF